MVNGRNRSIDAVKGILIFLVVIGHVLLGTLDENIIRYTIYSFHMPAFFFVSGYLLDMERLAGRGYWSVLSKYWKRMLAEWSVAWLVYTAYVLRHGNFDWMDVVQNLYAPFYHLWFVPALFVLITLLWLVFRLIRCNTVRFILLFALGLLTYNISNTSFNISSVFNCILMLFIVMGIYSRKYLNVINVRGGIIILFCILSIVCVYLFMESKIEFMRTYMEIPIASILCLLGILPMLQRGKFQGGIFEYWGRNSLRIYLWHVIPIICLKWLFSENPSLYYTVSGAVILMCIALTHAVNKRLLI